MRIAAIKIITDFKHPLFFICISLFFWLDINSFFWRDDWHFINAYLNQDLSQFLTSPYCGHVKPFFKLIFLGELFLFGSNALLFHITNLICFGLFAFIFSQVLQKIVLSSNIFFPVLISVIMCAHPLFSGITLWNFEICVILHLLFQALTLLCYFNYIGNKSKSTFSLFIIFLILQNYFFGNGIFFPLLFIFHQVYLYRLTNKRTLYVLFLIQFIFIIIQKIGGNTGIGIESVFENIIGIFSSFYRYLSVSIVRFFFMKHLDGPIGVYMEWVGYIIFVIICYLGIKKNKNIFMFGLAYLITSGMSIPIARPITDNLFPYYYSSLLLPPLFLLIYGLFVKIKFRSMNFIKFGLGIILCVYFILDIQVRRIYSYRNFKNKENLNTAIKYSKANYYPFDEPFATESKNLYADNFENASLQKSLMCNSTFETDKEINMYMDEKNIDDFLFSNHLIIENYKALKSKSFFNIDINYEKK